MFNPRMFNFQSTSTSTQIRSRASASDPELHRRLQNQSSHRSPGPPGPTGGRVTLPPLIYKSQSMTHASRNMAFQQREPPTRKLPSPKEMIFLTLKHVKPNTSRGLNFDQLYSFITGAFEIPRSYTLESKLRKTLSNMESKGVVEQSPGIEPRYVTYKLPENRHLDPSQTFCVSGKSIKAAPMWPTGYTLPAGGSLICRAGPRLKTQMTRPDMEMYQQNPHSMRPDPMPFMPKLDPMLCQSFGARAGLAGKMAEYRPNSRNSNEDGDGDFDPSFQDELHSPKTPRNHENSYHINSSFPPKCSPPRMLDTIPRSWSLDINEGDDEDDVFINNNEGFSHKKSAPAQTQVSCKSMDSNNDPDPETESAYISEVSNDSGRSCEIMNDLKVPRGVTATTSSPALDAQAVNLDKMDYLLGIADIIDSYEAEPPTLKISGAAPSRSKTSLKSAKSRA